RLALSPDAATIYYVSDLTGTMQLWSVPIAGGVPRRLSYEADRVGAYSLSPDGTKIAYGADEGGDERWALWVMNADGTEARRLSAVRDGSTKRLTPETPIAMHESAHGFADGILALSDRDRDMAAIARIGLDGSFSYLVAPDRVVDELEVAQKQVAYALNIDGRSEVRLLSNGTD